MKQFLRDNKGPVILTVAFVFSRLYLHLQGIVFNGGFIKRLWQSIDVELLKNHLLESLWYSHAQPPLFNAINGVVLKLTGSQYYHAFHALNLSWSLATILLFYTSLVRLRCSFVEALVFSLYWLFAPTLMLYENLYSYTIFTIFLLALTVYATICFIQRNDTRNWLILCTAVFALAMTRSAFHLFWVVLFTSLVLVLVQKKNVLLRKHVFIAGVFVLLICGWYTKNLILFNSFSASTWLGMNMARVVPVESALGRIGPFKALSEYDRSLVYEASYNAALLSRTHKSGTRFPNFHHEAYIQISSKFLHETTEAIKTRPSDYLRRVSESFMIYFNPAAHAPFIDKNYARLGAYAKVYNIDLTSTYVFNKHNFSLGRALPCMMLYITIIALSIWSLASHRTNRTEKCIIGLLLFILAYGMLVGNFLEYGENNRFRFEMIIPFLVLSAIVVRQFFRSFIAR